MKNDLMFKIGTLCSFFLIGIEYISKSIANHKTATFILNIFVCIVIIIILISVIYCVYNFFTYKEINFSFKRRYYFNIVNHLKYNVFVKDIIILDTNGIHHKINVFATNYQLNKNRLFLKCFAESKSLIPISFKNIVNPKTVIIAYFLTNKIDMIDIIDSDFLKNNDIINIEVIDRKLTFFEKRAIKKHK